MPSTSAWTRGSTVTPLVKAVKEESRQCMARHSLSSRFLPLPRSFDDLNVCNFECKLLGKKINVTKLIQKLNHRMGTTVGSTQKETTREYQNV